MILMVDVTRFKLYVYNTKVWKGWDWVKLPDGRVLKVREGKYLKIYKKAPKYLLLGFEDLTEEIGQRPDYDCDEPVFEVRDLGGFLFKKLKVRVLRFGGGYQAALYYDNKLIWDRKKHGTPWETEIEYVDWIHATLLGLSVGAAIAGIGFLVQRMK
ncbi:MAG: hypothetical protein DRG31_02350 [Deltaproteobacteria bacterium]|nr:MAG: hypothetical protein DRG31_02350 [Deltaproteobacteria bacterium]